MKKPTSKKQPRWRRLLEPTEANDDDGEEDELKERKRRREEARLRAVMASRAKWGAEDMLRRAGEEA